MLVGLRRSLASSCDVHLERAGFLDLFGIDISTAIESEEWRAAVIAFQKRHLIAHKLGVVDRDYVKKTGDVRAVVGRKTVVDTDEVKRLARSINTLAPLMVARLQESNRNS